MMYPAYLPDDIGYLGRVVMSKQSQHVLVTLPHPLLRVASLGLVAFILRYSRWNCHVSVRNWPRFGSQRQS